MSEVKTSGEEFRRDFSASLARWGCGRVMVGADFAADIGWHRLRAFPGVALSISTDADCAALAATLRQADIDTLAVMGHKDPLKSLRARLSASSHAVTARDRARRVICMFGIAPMNPAAGSGAPWLLGSDLIATHGRLFARLSIKYVAAMLELYPELENAIDIRDVRAPRWLRWLGFALADPLPLGEGGELFRPFGKRRPSDLLR